MCKTPLIVLCIIVVLLHCGHGRAAKKILNPYPYCGHRFIPATLHHKNMFSHLSKRIVGGQESIPGSWPWQVAMVMNGTQQCGGSLINRQWVVSAAHCFHDNYTSTNPKCWIAASGDHRLKEKDSFEQIKQVERIILHPKYKSMFMEGIFDTPPDYDIALVQLDSPVVLDNYVYPICLLRPGISFHPGQECYVTGWGHTKFNGTQPSALKEAKLKIVSTKTCNKKLSYAGKIHERAFCAGFQKGGVDACQFDSGGPLGCEKDGRFYLTGIVSWGHECARPHKYGVYADMVKLTSWVKRTMKRVEEESN